MARDPERTCLKLAAVIAAAIATNACSYFEQFFIINTSGKPLTIVASASIWHTVDSERRCAWTWSNPPTALPAIDASRVGKDYIPHDKFTTQLAVSVDDDSCSVRLTIAHGLALLAWNSSNGRRSPFLTSVTFGEEGFAGSELVKRFRKRSRAVYVLEFR